MKKILPVVIFAIVLTCPFTVSAAPQISAASAVVTDAATGRVLYEKSAYEKRGMASTTKIMTALLAIENLNFEDTVTVSPFAASTEGSSIWLSAGEHMTVSDLLYGLMLSSGNDAATALAEYTAGGVEAFTALMNEKAKELGACDTHFANPHGLPDDEHYTTAYDLALISSYAMRNEKFRSIVAEKSKTISWENSEWNRSLKNHNKLLSMRDYFIGIKTGFTKKDGRCLVSAAEKGSMRIITVTLSAPDDWNDHINLTEWAFESFVPYEAAKKCDYAGRLAVQKCDVDFVETEYSEDVTFALLAGEEKEVTRELSFFSLVYPVNRGDAVGRVDFFLNGEKIFETELLSRDDAYLKRTYGDIIISLVKGIMRF